MADHPSRVQALAAEMTDTIAIIARRAGLPGNPTHYSNGTALHTPGAYTWLNDPEYPGAPARIAKRGEQCLGN
ncbi:hypothetical protein F7230_06905 [Corynebacterium sp. 320]|uniref:hypothetical protein n=2 Tax=Corynebacteriaceae TaxID=1653 RepID=UPI00125CB382|nr:MULTISPECIES: hypothetical protein [Corynebacterium]KAB1554749.1 hypothetical protein F7233_00220 [Corynebacterium sp. 321]KAB1502739.1 hypothetical protein F7230_06905 [Corynebacterium sp. 320]KAB1550523.1 hypothetical protein F7232_09605 [Corynebacterium sp. 319]KAB3526402.1 hypothetical protein F8354_06905 [Corynebacterium sp. 250]KAB3537745.1 hypothetical protein F8390_09810 [Corynebacterium sp. 366]